MIRKFRKPLWAILFAVYLLSLSGTPAIAGMIGSVTLQMLNGQETRQQQIDAIQRALENEIVKAKLEAYGLTPDEIQTKLQGLSDEQLHLLAQASDDVLAGGDGEGVIIVLLIIVIVILAIYVTGHRVVVK
jgi:hypothetical protein